MGIKVIKRSFTAIFLSVLCWSAIYPEMAFGKESPKRFRSVWLEYDEVKLQKLCTISVTSSATSAFDEIIRSDDCRESIISTPFSEENIVLEPSTGLAPVKAREILSGIFNYYSSDGYAERTRQKILGRTNVVSHNELLEEGRKMASRLRCEAFASLPCMIIGPMIQATIFHQRYIPTTNPTVFTKAPASYLITNLMSDLKGWSIPEAGALTGVNRPWSVWLRAYRDFLLGTLWWLKGQWSSKSLADIEVGIKLLRRSIVMSQNINDSTLKGLANTNLSGALIGYADILAKPDKKGERKAVDLFVARTLYIRAKRIAETSLRFGQKNIAYNIIANSLLHFAYTLPDGEHRRLLSESLTLGERYVVLSLLSEKINLSMYLTAAEFEVLRYCKDKRDPDRLRNAFFLLMRNGVARNAEQETSLRTLSPIFACLVNQEYRLLSCAIGAAKGTSCKRLFRTFGVSTILPSYNLFVERVVRSSLESLGMNVGNYVKSSTAVRLSLTLPDRGTLEDVMRLSIEGSYGDFFDIKLFSEGRELTGTSTMTACSGKLGLARAARIGGLSSVAFPEILAKYPSLSCRAIHR